MALHDYRIRLSGRGQKILRFPLTRLILALVFMVSFTGVGMTLASLIVRLSQLDGSGNSASFIQMLFACSFSIIGYWVYCGLIEGRPVYEMNPKKLIAQTGYGLMLGFGFISVIMLIMWVSGGYVVRGFHPLSLLVPVLIMSLQAGIMEEILSRGIVFRIAEEGIGTWLSVFLSALIFGFMHIWNPNATIFSCISIALTAGVILGMLYVITRQLWVPIGMHIGWNFTLGGIYGAPVSGGEPAGLLNASFPGPEWLTGGAFGPEASVITLAVFLVFGAFLIGKSIRDKSYIGPMWRKNR